MIRYNEQSVMQDRAEALDQWPAEDLAKPGGRGQAEGLGVSRAEAGLVADLFRLLGDHTRSMMLFALLEAGELSVRALAAQVGASETNTSHALRLLRTARVVRSRRVGRTIYYGLDDEHVRMLLELSREHLGHEGHGAKP
jgi:ArsR family transcriptional regulator, lead/cadmium/zinc/bismuth-responsive transcriptional repressor